MRDISNSKGKIFRHFKGDLYLVEDFVKHSETISKQQKAEFEKDIFKCEELTLEKYQNRSRGVKVKESLSRLFSGVL